MTVDVVTTTMIDRPCEVVALYAMNPASAAEWYANIERVEWKTSPPLRVGSALTFVAHFLGRRLAYTYEIVELQAGSVPRLVDAPNPSGAMSGGTPSLFWTAVPTSNTIETTRYRVYRSTWNASTQSWIDNGIQAGETTGTNFTDASPQLSMRSYQGTVAPNGSAYSYVRYTVRALNSGVGAESVPVYFRGLPL